MTFSSKRLPGAQGPASGDLLNQSSHAKNVIITFTLHITYKLAILYNFIKKEKQEAYHHHNRIELYQRQLFIIRQLFCYTVNNIVLSSQTLRLYKSLVLTE